MVTIQMVKFNHILIARLFLVGLAVFGIYSAVSAKSPDEIALVPCVFHTVTDVPCPGCGMTRACLSITHGHIIDAWGYHPFSFLIVGLALGIAIFPTQMTEVWNRQSNRTRNCISICGIVLCLSVWFIKLKSMIW